MAKNSSIKDTTPQQWLLVIFIFMFVIALSFYFLFYKNKQSDYETLKQKMVTLDRDIASLKQREGQLMETRKEAERMEARLAILRAKIPETSDELNYFLSSISQRAASAKVDKWNYFKQEGLIAQNEVSVVPIRMEFEATYEAAINFFWELSTMGDGLKTGSKEQIVNIRGVRMERASQSGASKDLQGLLKISCVAETYLYTGTQLQAGK
ncbi:MAG: type 4a pilus biogenesis protein PilO [Bradymonadales bacterium]|jgi:Tfp pilus assembly protein PilO